MGLPLPSFTSQISFGIPVRLCFRKNIFFVYVTLSIYLSTSATRAPFRVAESGFNKTVVAFRSSYPFLAVAALLLQHQIELLAGTAWLSDASLLRGRLDLLNDVLNSVLNFLTAGW